MIGIDIEKLNKTFNNVVEDFYKKDSNKIEKAFESQNKVIKDAEVKFDRNLKIKIKQQDKMKLEGQNWVELFAKGGGTIDEDKNPIPISASETINKYLGK
jgi:hypothetical protein